MKDSVNINSVNSFCIIINELDGSIAEKKWKSILNFCFYR